MKNMAQRSNRILDTLRAVPGVKAAALTSTLPGISNQQETEFRIIEGEQDPNRKIVADIRFVSTGYFDTLHIPLLAGEPCQDVHSAMTAVVNRSFAATYFGQSPAIGHHVATTDSSQYPITGEIRGIVGDAREQGLNTEPVPTVYWCSNLAFPGTHYLVRTQGEPQEFVNTLRRTIHQIEPSRSVFDLQPLQERLEGSFAEDRLRRTLLSPPCGTTHVDIDHVCLRHPSCGGRTLVLALIAIMKQYIAVRALCSRFLHSIRRGSEEECPTSTDDAFRRRVSLRFGQGRGMQPKTAVLSG